MKMYFEDLEEGVVFRGDVCVADKEEMLDYARKNDPSPFHVDEEAARNSPYGGLIARRGRLGRRVIPRGYQ
jgi:acyl dehydratase